MPRWKMTVDERAAHQRATDRAKYARDKPRYLARVKAYAKKHAAKKRAYAAEYRRAHRDTINDQHRKRLYGLPAGRFKQMLLEQAGVCAVCGAPPRKRALNVDHCHMTGAVRGLLCDACNIAIGMLCDSPERLERAAAYLRRHQQPALLAA